MNAVTIPKPQRDDKGKIRGEFYPLQRAELLALRDSELARGPFYVHLCLRFENPWCDRPFSVSVTQFCKRWHIPESNFYRAISKLQEMEILDWEPREIFFYWKSPISESQFPVVGDSPSSESDSPSSESDSPSSESDSPSSESDSPSSENLQSPGTLLDKAFSDKAPQTIQNISDSTHTFSESNESEKEQQNSAVENSRAALLNKPDTSTQASQLTHEGKSSATVVDPFFARRPKPQEIEWDWAPEGEWKVSGKLDANFVDWHARRWMQKYGAIDIHEARKNVRAYYRNDPRRLADDWQEYHESTLHKAANIAVRQSNGINVSDAEKAAVAKHQAALIPSDKSVVRSQYEEVKEYIPSIDPEQILIPKRRIDAPMFAAEKEIDWDAVNSATEQWEAEQISQASMPEGADNPQAYINTVKPEDSDYYRRLHEQREGLQKAVSHQVPTSDGEGVCMIQNAIANIKPMPKPTRAERQAATRIQHWINLLQTGIPSVIADVERQVKAAGMAIVDGCVVEDGICDNS